ncbi:MAG: response regulator transcription factor [Propionibacteriaceae bacterium]|jgi:DNA-binding NarL/FixJ family response regulator|nr:response regulator transcription factor [Propionibacteriaceae bacterium]
MIKVMLVDDQEMIRVGLRAIIDAQPGMEVVAEAGDGFAAVRAFEAAAPDVPDVVLMDLRMPGVDGVEATRRIRRAHPASEARIVVLTTFDQDANVLAAIKAGANGFLSKGVRPPELAAAIAEVYDGGGALSANAARVAIGHIADDNSVPVDSEAARLLEYLTVRELETLKAAARGLDNKQIAGELHITVLTAKTYINRAMMKLGVSDRAALVTIAYKAGLRP